MKNLKKSLFAVAVALTVFSFGACDTRDVVIEQEKEAAETSRVTFNIVIPKGDPVTYATQDETEWGLGNLWVYEFTENGTYANHESVSFESKVGPEFTYTYTMEDANGKKMARFIFVANEETDPGVVANIATLEEKLAGKYLNDNSSSADLLNTIGDGESEGKYIPMTGEAMIGTSNLIPVSGTVAKATVCLTRIVARIDVKNHVPNLVITGLSLSQTNSQSYLFPHPDYAVPGTATKVNNITLFTTLPAEGLAHDGELAKAFYLYEGPQPDKTGAVTLEVKGELGEAKTPVLYRIPFWNNSAEQSITVKRNNIYRITLGNNTPVVNDAKVGFTIENTPWGETLYNEPFEVISAQYTGGEEATYNDALNCLEVGKGGSDALTFTFTSKYTDAYTWEVASSTAEWLTGVFAEGGNLTISVTENDSGAPREGKIVIKTNLENSATYEILVKQKNEE